MFLKWFKPNIAEDDRQFHISLKEQMHTTLDYYLKYKKVGKIPLMYRQGCHLISTCNYFISSFSEQDPRYSRHVYRVRKRVLKEFEVYGFVYKDPMELGPL